MASRSQSILQEFQVKLEAHYGKPQVPLAPDRFEAIVLAILRQNSDPEKTAAVFQKVKNIGLNSAAAIRQIEETRLIEALKELPQARNKAQRLKRFFAWFLERFDDSFDALDATETNPLHEAIVGLPGVGPETADQILLEGLDRAKFPVNQAAYRILARHHLIAEDADYSQIQEVLQSVSEDPEDYRQMRAWLSKIGKEFCKSVPECEACPLNGVNW